MRFVKMMDQMLKTGEDLHIKDIEGFFALVGGGSRDGWFLVPKGWIGEGELTVG
jgi:hypothetical protein